MSASEHVGETHGVRLVDGLTTGTSVRRTRRRRAIVRRWLVAADVVGLVLAFVLVGGTALVSENALRNVALFALTLPLWVLGARLFGLYAHDNHLDHSTLDELWPLVLFVTFGTWLGLVTASILELDWSMRDVVAFWAVASVSIPVLRGAARSFARHSEGYVQNTLIVGAGDVGQLVGRKLRQHPELGIRLVGFVDADPKSMRADLDGVPILGTPDDIATLVRDHDVQRVVVSFSNDRHEQQLGLIHGLRDLDVQVDLVPRLFEAVGPVVAIHDVEGLKLLTLPPVRPSRVAPRPSGEPTSRAPRSSSRSSRRSSSGSRGASGATRRAPSSSVRSGSERTCARSRCSSFGRWWSMPTTHRTVPTSSRSWTPAQPPPPATSTSSRGPTP